MGQGRPQPVLGELVGDGQNGSGTSPTRFGEGRESVGKNGSGTSPTHSGKG